jgi:hypothetical protein
VRYGFSVTTRPLPAHRRVVAFHMNSISWLESIRNEAHRGLDGPRAAAPAIARNEDEMAWNQLEMTNGTKYRVLVEFTELVQQVDTALKAGGLLTLPMGIKEPGNPVTINPQHVVQVINGTY